MKLWLINDPSYFDPACIVGVVYFDQRLGDALLVKIFIFHIFSGKKLKRGKIKKFVSLKMHIVTSSLGAQHPNAGRNIQHVGFIFPLNSIACWK